MKKRSVKLILSGESILGKGFPDMEQIVEIDDTPEMYAIICTNKNIKKWEFQVSSKYSGMKEVLNVATRIIEDAGVQFGDVNVIMNMTQIVCDALNEDCSMEELSRRLIKSRSMSDIKPELGMMKSMIGKIVQGGDMRRIWVEGIINCVKDGIDIEIGAFIRHIYN
jgi:hypothetical protein